MAYPSNSDNRPHKHHYIPVFYTKRWAGADGRLCQYSRPHKEVVATRRHPDATGFMRDGYTLEGFEPELAQQVEEHFFRRIDGSSARALELMEMHGNRAPWNTRTRSAWTRFILGLELRCPEDIASLRECFRLLWSEVPDEQEATYQEIREPHLPATFREYLDAFPIVHRERHTFELLYMVVDNERVGKRMNEMAWYVMEIPADAPLLLTSDRPIVRTSNLAAPQGHFSIAIGPRHLFFASHDGRGLSHLTHSQQKQVVKEYNRQIVQSAVKYVYGVDDSQLAFVRKHMGTDIKPRSMEKLVTERRERAAQMSTIRLATPGPSAP